MEPIQSKISPIEQIKICWPTLKKRFTYKALSEELKEMRIGASPATLSNVHQQIIKANATKAADSVVSKDKLGDLAEAFLVLVENYDFKTIDINTKKLVEIADLGDASQFKSTNSTKASSITLYEDGRKEIADKVKFLKSAQIEIIEIGVRLNTFTQYFKDRKDSEFKQHIIEQMNKGVNMKYLMMDPSGDLARMYFGDRAKILQEEQDAYLQMAQTMKDLLRVRDELNAASTKGQMKVYIYNSLPSNHYLIVDGEHKNGKMLLTPYLYGISRANCPVVELHQQKSPIAFEKYRQSAEFIIKQAIEI